MQVDILTPDHSLFSGEVTSVSLPGVNGRFQILQRHAPLVSSLVKGDVVIETSAGKEQFSIEGGIVEVLKNKVVILA